MIKKLMFGGGAVLLLLGLMFGTEALSYVKTGVARTREAVKNNVSIEFQLDRARQLIKDLDPEIKQNMHKIAKEEVELEGLRKQQEGLETRLSKSSRDLQKLNGDLQRGDSSFVYAGKSFTGSQVKKELEHRFESHKTIQSTSDNIAQIIARREQGLAAAQQKLRDMRMARQQLEVEVANLAARREMVKVAHDASHVCTFDDSSLSRARALIQDIDTRIGVDEKLINADTSGPAEINLEESTESDISEEISQYFNNRATESLATSE
jgi:chromosome segregation ATPase